jgi:hemoglobin
MPTPILPIQDGQPLISEQQIAALVDTFYTRVRQDETLGPVFERAIGGEWEPHLKRMRAFWSSLLLASGRYKGNPMTKHMMLLPRIGPEHFERWLNLWRQTATDVLPPQAARVFVNRAEIIAERLLSSVDQYHDSLVTAKPGSPFPEAGAPESTRPTGSGNPARN